MGYLVNSSGSQQGLILDFIPGKTTFTHSQSGVKVNTVLHASHRTTREDSVALQSINSPVTEMLGHDVTMLERWLIGRLLADGLGPSWEHLLRSKILSSSGHM